MAGAAENDQKDHGERARFSPSIGESLIALGIAFLFLGLHAATYSYYPASWCDEVTYCEPGINLAQGRGLTTQIWQFQPANTFWAVNPPLYPVLLAGWVKAFGASLLGVRSFNFTLFSIASLLLWAISWRHRIVSQPLLRLGLMVLAHCGFGLSLAYRSARPDVVPMVALLLLVLTVSWRPSALRAAVSALLAFAIPFMGLQVALYLAIVATLACLLGLLPFRMLLGLGIAAATGAAALYVILVWQDAWNHFRTSVHAVTQAGGIWGFVSALKAYAKDLSAVPLLLASGALSLRFVGSKRAAAGLGLAACVYVLVPIVFCVSADFRSYYAYMIFLPLLLAFGYLTSSAWESGRLGGKTWPLWVAGGAALCSAMVGLPMRLATTATCAQLMPRTETRLRVTSVLSSRDTVFTEYMTFFEAKLMTANVWVPFSAKGLGHIEGPGRELSQVEREATTLLIVRPEGRADVTAYFGGNWEPVTAPFGDTLRRPQWMPERAFRIAQKVIFDRAPTARHHVEILRRTPAKEPRG